MWHVSQDFFYSYSLCTLIKIFSQLTYMHKRGNLNKYVKEYQWSNIFAMLRNQNLDPEICLDDFKNRLVVITGATSGIGYAAALKYASHGADILSINRNEKRSIELCEKIQSQFGVLCNYMIADFAKLDDIHAAAKQLAAIDRNIDVLIHNAGVYVTQKTITEDNLELTFEINYLSTFILNHYTKDKFIKQNSGRIIYVNSEAHRFAVWGLYLDDLNWEKHSYSGLKSYGAAKTAQLLSMIKLVDVFHGTNITVNAMHPGNVITNSGQHNGTLYKIIKKIVVDPTARPLEISGESLYYLGVSNKVAHQTGKFFNLTTEEEPAPPALDSEAADDLWILSHKLGGIT